MRLPVDSFIVGMAAGPVLFSGHGLAVASLGTIFTGFVNVWCAKRSLKVQ
jgi:hypothetical protein